MRININNEGVVTAHAENDDDILKLMAHVIVKMDTKTATPKKRAYNKKQKVNGVKRRTPSTNKPCPYCPAVKRYLGFHIKSKHPEKYAEYNENYSNGEPKKTSIAPTGFPSEGAYERGEFLD